MVGLVDEPGCYGIPEVDTAQRVVQICREPKPLHDRDLHFDFHSVRFPFVEIGIRIDPRIGEQNSVNGIVADPIVTGQPGTEVAQDRMSDTEFELVFDDGLKRRQSFRTVLKESRQSSARN